MSTIPQTTYLTAEQMDALTRVHEHMGKKQYSISAVLAELIEEKDRALLLQKKRQLAQLDQIQSDQAFVVATITQTSARIASVEANLQTLFRERKNVPANSNSRSRRRTANRALRSKAS